MLEEQLRRELFRILYLPLLAGTGVSSPVLAFQLSRAESNQETLELVRLTTLSTRRLLSGKVHAALLLSLMQCSAIVPFLSLAYALGGLSLLAVLWVLGSLLGNTYVLSLVGVACGLGGTRWWSFPLAMLTLIGGCGLASFSTWICSGVGLGEQGGDSKLVCAGILWIMMESLIGMLSASFAGGRINPWIDQPRLPHWLPRPDRNAQAKEQLPAQFG